MKILHFIWSMGVGGAESMLVDIVNNQVEIHEVYLLIGNCIESDSIISNISKKVKILRLNRAPGSRNPYYLLKLNWLIHRLSPDILHTHSENLIKALWCKKIKKVVTIHDSLSDLNKSLLEYDSIVAISNAVKNDIVFKLPKATPLVIYNGIDFKQIKPIKKMKTGKFKIVQIGRLFHQQKGQDVLLRAIDYLCHHYNFTDFHVDFIGDGTSFEYLSKMAADLHISEFCRFLGRQTRTQIYSSLCEYDLLVQPSNLEGFGLTIVEGMASGLPVLVSDIDGPMEIIQGGKYGYFFHVGNYVDCADKLFEIARDKRDGTLPSTDRSYRFAEDNFNIVGTSSRYIETYESLLRCSGRPIISNLGC